MSWMRTLGRFSGAFAISFAAACVNPPAAKVAEDPQLMARIVDGECVVITDGLSLETQTALCAVERGIYDIASTTKSMRASQGAATDLIEAIGH